MTAPIGADETRVRQMLRARGIAYNPGAPMPEPITPTRVIPAAELPHRPPRDGEVPPWRIPPQPPTPTPPPPPEPPVPTPAPPPAAVVRHVHEIVLVAPDPDPEPAPTRWDRARAAFRSIGRPWQLAAALTLAVAPVLPGRYSLAVTWMWCVHHVRADHGQGWGYALALGTIALATTAVARHGDILRITAAAIAVLGLLGAVEPFDPITWITGVHQ